MMSFGLITQTTEGQRDSLVFHFFFQLNRSLFHLFVFILSVFCCHNHDMDWLSSAERISISSENQAIDSHGYKKGKTKWKKTTTEFEPINHTRCMCVCVCLLEHKQLMAACAIVFQAYTFLLFLLFSLNQISKMFSRLFFCGCLFFFFAVFSFSIFLFPSSIRVIQLFFFSTRIQTRKKISKCSRLIRSSVKSIFCEHRHEIVWHRTEHTHTCIVSRLFGI